MNIVLWIADSLRPDHLGVYGCLRNTSPNIDKLAEDGVVFENAFVQATWTRPSSGTLFTGMYPAVHGARTFIHGLRPTAPRLPALLQDAGMATGVFTAMGYVSAAAGYAEGVDFFSEIWREEPYASGKRPSYLVTAEETRAKAEQWMKQQLAEGTPFFALLWTIDTHVPFEIKRARQYFPETQFEEDDFSIESIEGIWAAKTERHLQAILDAYDASIMETDAEFGKVVQFLRDEGVYDDTLIIILGDHGEIFNEHSRGQFFPYLRLLEVAHRFPVAAGLIRRYRLLNCFGWLGHLDIPPYDETLSVPLVAKFPGNRWRGRREVATVEAIDLPPTLLALVNRSDSTAPMQGVNLLPLLEGEVDNCHDFTFSDSQTYDNRIRYVSVQQGDWKLIRAIAPRIENIFDVRGRLQAYLQRLLARKEILVNVHDEHKDWKQEEPEIYNRLQTALDGWLASNERLATTDNSVVDDQRLRDQLIGLGYLSE